jgi:hypothetical protein
MGGSDARDLERALSKNRGRRLVADWSQLLSRACGIEISAMSFLSIEETAVLKRAFYNLVKDERKRARAYWKKSERNDLGAHLSSMGTRARSLGPVVLFSSVDQFVGAVRIKADCVLQNAMRVWHVVGEDLSAVTDDLHHGLCLEENFYTDEGEYVREGLYELSVWGEFGVETQEGN